ncbi:glycerol-3-phosphate dehydrogenase (NAD(P)+) [Rhizobium sp. SG_E_25_P2]|uniref:NAD(P)H-dependent glycerol-3-phosphate dehydrogenase n=1 Tax=Rhizobium sp. SG_E_25_P2 TaxID=2879942 RepID=UPI002476DED5|nr:NAD(P)H-dependent glycerol-3-phosphate dehydrogenase [Rhizobium sp. SG_E_25_P2]MDH6267584.1 glycerol-3-phosphate dehydrogenase (NAD(P)+) [Rhizobium sp. SG_E_25_P2]
MSKRLVVVGSGAFGTALAAASTHSGNADVILLCRDEAQCEDMRKTGVNSRNLPGLRLPDDLSFSSDASCLELADVALFVMPSQAQRAAARALGDHLRPNMAVITCAKGIDRETGELLTNLLERELPGRRISVLSGPGFAADIARGLPTAMVLASATLEEADAHARLISGPTFRLYASADRIGVQLGGALKNVLAIACGIIEGAGLGDSARAALISRGLAEMSRFAAAFGGDAHTVRGLSGLGDLVLTATSHQSRNLRFGIETGRSGRAVLPSGELVEGAAAAAVAARLATERGVDMPVTNAVASIIEGNLDVASAMNALMTRPITTE